ncbi:MAG: DUF3300 domain-containing protein [Phycisphaerales bacterium]|nr:DUF3300 domain-containing protein [Phycisphaerales bacterium]
MLLLCVGSPTSILMAENGAQPATAAPAAPAAAAPAPAAADASDKLSQEQIDQLVAPIALYPDDLLTQLLMASTYPLEIVQADRWVKAHKDLKGDALDKALEAQTWDPSVKALVAFPDTLSMMSEKLDITSKLGDAFIAQQKDVMDAIQRLRNKAQAAGNLQSNQQQTVTVQPAAAGSQTQTIIIQPAQPEVVYVPQYNPTVVYGAWPYPAYPPAPYYPPGYVAGTALLSFGVGVAVGAIWNNNCNGNANWNSGSVNINNNINRNTNISGNNINRNNTNIQGGNRTNVSGGGQWQHNPQHRQGVPYSNKATAQQFGGVDRAQASQARNDFRGRESGGQSAFGGNQAGNGAGNGAGNRGGAGQGGAGQGGAGGNRGGSAQTRPANNGAFGDVNKGGGAARDASNRGSNSRGTASQQPARQNNAGGGGGGRQQAQPSRGGGGGGAQRSAPASRPTGGGSRGGGGGGGRGGGGRR